MSANEFRRRKEAEALSRHIAAGDWMCDRCTRPGLVQWHGKDQRCPKVSAGAQEIRDL